MAFPAIIPVAILYILISILIYLIGTVLSISFNKSDAGLTNQQITNAGTSLVIENIADCIASIESNTSLTQDERVPLIADCNTNNLQNWWDTYQKVVFPDADHSDLGKGITEVETCASTYFNSARSAADYAVFKTCSKTASDVAVKTDQAKTLEIYKPDASATKKEPGINYLLYISIGVAAIVVGYILSKKPTQIRSGYDKVRSLSKSRSNVPQGTYQIIPR